MPDKEATNTFTGGLNKDLNPLSTPNNILTDCVNGTLVTFNGDEMTLQNDAGNTKIPEEYPNNPFTLGNSYLAGQYVNYLGTYYKAINNVTASVTPNNDTTNWSIPDGSVKLKTGYYPIGIKQFGGVLYIVSTDGTNIEFGSYPSPEYVQEQEKPSGEQSLIITQGNIINYLYVYSMLNSTVFASGDYIVFSSTIDMTYVSDSTKRFYVIKLFQQLNNGFLELTDDAWTKYNAYKLTNTSDTTTHWINDSNFKYYCPNRYKGNLDVEIEIEPITFAMSYINSPYLYTGYCITYDINGTTAYIYNNSTISSYTVGYYKNYFTVVPSSVLLNGAKLLSTPVTLSLGAATAETLVTISAFTNSTSTITSLPSSFTLTVNGTTTTVIRNTSMTLTVAGTLAGTETLVITSNNLQYTLTYTKNALEEYICTESKSGMAVDSSGNIYDLEAYGSSVTIQSSTVFTSVTFYALLKTLDGNDLNTYNYIFNPIVKYSPSGYISCSTAHVSVSYVDSVIGEKDFPIGNIEFVVPNGYNENDLSYKIVPNITVTNGSTVLNYQNSDGSIDDIPDAYIDNYTLTGEQYISGLFSTLICTALYGECDYTNHVMDYNIIKITDTHGNPVDTDGKQTSGNYLCVNKSGYSVPSGYTSVGTYTISNGLPVISYTQTVNSIIQDMLSNTPVVTESDECNAEQLIVYLYNPNNAIQAISCSQNGSSISFATGSYNSPNTSYSGYVLQNVETTLNVTSPYKNTYTFVPSNYTGGLYFLDYCTPVSFNTWQFVKNLNTSECTISCYILISIPVVSDATKNITSWVIKSVVTTSLYTNGELSNTSSVSDYDTFTLTYNSTTNSMYYSGYYTYSEPTRGTNYYERITINLSSINDQSSNLTSLNGNLSFDNYANMSSGFYISSVNNEVYVNSSSQSGTYSTETAQSGNPS